MLFRYEINFIFILIRILYIKYINLNLIIFILIILELLIFWILKKEEQFIDYLYSIRNISGCVIPDGKVYDNDLFIGIFMHYYRSYVNLEHIIANNIKNETKLNILKDAIAA